MSSPIAENTPNLVQFYRYGLSSVQGSCDTQCSICFEAGDDAVSVDPCKHIFHRQCLIKWFRSSVLTRPNVNELRGRCPNCRRELFHCIGALAPFTNAHTWVQTLHGLRDTQFEAIGSEALRCIHNSGGLSLDLVDHLVRKMVQENHDYEPIALELGVLQPPTPPRPRICLALEQHQVNVDNEDFQFVNQTLRGDVQSLQIATSQHMPDLLDALRERIDWSAVVDAILQAWQSSNYPRTTYVTMPQLHRLIIHALLLHMESRSSNNIRSYECLLAHGARLLQDTQQHVASGRLTETELLEHHRVLDWRHFASAIPSNAAPTNSRHTLTYYPHNLPRIEWIIELRTAVCGPHADPMNFS